MTRRVPRPNAEPGASRPPSDRRRAPADELARPGTGVVRATGRYTARFVRHLRLARASILAGAIAGFVVLVVKPGHVRSPAGWSTWAPPHGSTAKMTNEIADHVAHEYRLNKGGAQLVAVVSEPPEVTSGTHKISISNIAVRETATDEQGHPDHQLRRRLGRPALRARPELRDLLGEGDRQPRAASSAARRSRSRSTPSSSCPSISSIVAFMPPPPGSTASTLLYLQKANLTKQLSQPLAKTLPLATPPLPTSPDTDRGLDDRQADAPGGLQVPAAAAPGRERAARPEPLLDLTAAQAAWRSTKARTRCQASAEASA